MRLETLAAIVLLVSLLLASLAVILKVQVEPKKKKAPNGHVNDFTGGPGFRR